MIAHCADPNSRFSGKRITLASSSLGEHYGSQEKVIANADIYWYITSASISNNSASYLASTVINIAKKKSAILKKPQTVI